MCGIAYPERESGKSSRRLRLVALFSVDRTQECCYTTRMIPKHFTITAHYVQTFGLDSLVPELFSYTEMLEFLEKLDRLSFYTTGANSHHVVNPGLFSQILRIFETTPEAKLLAERMRNAIGYNYVALGTEKNEFLKVVRVEDVTASLMGLDSGQTHTLLQKLSTKYQFGGRNTYDLISSTDFVVNAWDKHAPTESLRLFHRMFSDHYVAL